MKEMVGGCCVCSDDRGWPENPLVYCDGQSCTVAVHQACYGIVTVPTGPWYCRKCESQERTARVKCELCPSKYGALKRTDNSGWAHVVCALYIPEVRFGNVTTMEPIQLQLIPAERFNKACYICEEQGKASSAPVGACMQCNKAGCKQQFHVTCAQTLGLLCEEAGNYLDNVKYCGYCQHHYSKLKKGGNVKTIPPYKPISTENHHSDSNSEKEADASATLTKSSSSQPVSTGKRSKASSSSKTSSSSSKSTSSSKGSSGSTHQKTVHNNSSKSEKDKSKVTNSNTKSAKNSEDSAVLTSAEPVAEVKLEKLSSERNSTVVKDVKAEVEPEPVKIEIKETKISKKRKNNSRTPTPITVPNDSVIPAANLSVLIPELSASVLSGIASGNTIISSIISEKRESIIAIDSSDKIKKAKIELIQSTPAPTVLSAAPSSTPTVVKSIPSPPTPIDQAIVPTAIVSPSSIPSTIHTGPSLPPVNSLVVSVPLLNTNLSPHSHIVSNQTSVVTLPPSYTQERNCTETSTPNNLNSSLSMTGGSSSQSTGVITSEMSGGGLKVTYEKQPAAGTTLRAELERGLATEQTVPVKRSRSMSGEKSEKVSRSKKRSVNAMNAQYNATSNKRASRSQHATPPPHSSSIIPANQIKESPPSSPSSESQGVPPTRAGRTKGRKSAPAAVPTTSTNTKDTKDGLKVFQNGVSAPHMLGNQLNPNSNMAQKMSDHLSSELEAHSIFNASEQSALIGPQLHHRVLANVSSLASSVQSARSSSTGGSSTASGGSGFSMLGGSGGTIPQTLDQLLERQWEQGSQFLMEQAQHFDIASLLSCLHQLRAENLRLEEHVSSLLQRRDHLLAVNARLAIPLTGQPATPQGSHSHTVNNIHPSVVASHGDVSRSRHSSASYSSHSQVPPQHSSVPIENGLPPEPNQPYPHHRSPANNQSQPSSTVRHSPAGSTGYPSSGLVRQSGGDSGRTAPRPQHYPLYQGPGPSTAQTQMVIRRDPELHHQPSSKPS